VEFGMTDILTWWANTGETPHCITPHNLQCYNQPPFLEAVCYLTSCSGNPKTGYNETSKSMGTPCHTVWVGFGHKRQLWRREEVLLRPTEKFKQ
jgi:hypothetical protein